LHEVRDWAFPLVPRDHAAMLILRIVHSLRGWQLAPRPHHRPYP
jgi:hypothetical protein